MSGHWKHPPKRRKWLERNLHNIIDAALIMVLIMIWVGYLIAIKDLGL